MSGFQKIGTASLSIVPDFDGFVSELRAKLESVRAELDIPVDAELGQFFSALERARERAERTKADLNIGADDAAARAKLDELKAQAARGGDFNLGLDSARAAAEYLAFKEMVERGADMPIRIRIDRSQLDEIRRLSGSVSGGGKNDIIPNEGDTRRSKNEVNGLANALERLGRVANRNRGLSLRNIGPIGISAISAAVVGLTGDLAGLVGMAGAAAGALAAIGSGIGVGFSGVGAALSALRSSPSGASAAVAAKEQAQSLADAQHSVEAAQRAVANATQDTTDKYKAQGEAIRDAGRELRDLNDQLKDAELSQEGAAISAARAEERYQETLAKYRQGRASGLDLQEADFNRRSAQQRLRESQSNLFDQREDTSEANRLGIAGNPKVVAANKAVTDSIQAQKDARYDLAKAISALEIASQKASIGSKFDEAMAKLSPNAKQFINDLRSLGDEWKNTRLVTQDALFEGMGPTVKQLAENQLPAVTEGLSRMAGLANGVVKQSLADLDTQFTTNANNGTFRDFLSAVEDSFSGMPNLITGTVNAVTDMTRISGPALGQMFGSLGTGLSNSSGTFGNLGKHLSEQLARGFEGMPEFMRKLEGPMRSGMDFIGKLFSTIGTVLKNNAPELQRFVDALTTDLLPVIERLGDYLGPLLNFFTGLFNLMGSFPTETAAALALLFVSKQIAGIAGPLATVWKQFAVFRDNVASGWGRMSSAAGVGATAIRDSFNRAASGASGFMGSLGRVEGNIRSTAANGATALGGLATRGFGAVQTAAGKLASFIGPGGALTIALVAGIAIWMGYEAAQRKAAQAAENARDLAMEQAQAQRDLNKALEDSRGAVTPEVTTGVAKQVADLKTGAKNTKDYAPSWYESAWTQTMAALNGGPGDRNIIGVKTTADQDLRNNVDRSNAGVAADSLLQTLENKQLGLTNTSIAEAITGSQADFDALISKVKAVGDGGEDAAKALQGLRDNFVRTQEAARTLTPGVSTLADSMKTLASDTATAEEKARALQTALDMLAGKKPDETKALQGYGDAIRSMMDSLKEIDKTKGFGSSLIGKDGSLNVESANGSAALNYLTTVRNGLSDLSAAGTLTGEKYDEAVGKMSTYLQGLGVSAAQAKVILDKNLGLNDQGRQLLLDVKLTGAKETETNLQAIKLKLERENGKVEISPTIATAGVRAELERLQGVVVRELPNKNFEITADNAEALQKIQETIDRNVFLDKMKAGPHATLVTDDFIRKYIETQESIDKLDKSKAKPEVTALIDKFKSGKTLVEDDLATLNRLRAEPAIDANTKAALDRIAELNAEIVKPREMVVNGIKVNPNLAKTLGAGQFSTTPDGRLTSGGLSTDGKTVTGTLAKPAGGLSQDTWNSLSPEAKAAVKTQPSILALWKQAGIDTSRATGGPVYGPGSGNVDTIPVMLANEEYVQQADAHRYYGTPFMDAINNKQIPRGAIPGFKTGGTPTPNAGVSGGTVQLGNVSGEGITTQEQQDAWDVIRRAFPTAKLASATRTQDVGSGFDFHMAGEAVDIVDTPAVMNQIAQWIATNYPSSRELIHGPGFAGQIKNGKIVGDGGGSFGFYAGAGRHDDHVHWTPPSGFTFAGGEALTSTTGTQSPEQAAAQKKVTDLQAQIDALSKGNPDKAEKITKMQTLTQQWSMLKEQEKNLSAEQQKQLKDYEAQIKALTDSESDPSVLQAVTGLTATKRQAELDLAKLVTPTVGTATQTATGTGTTGTSTSTTKPTLNASGLSFDGGLTRLGEMFGNFFFPAGSVLNPSGYDKSTTTTGVNALNPAPATNANGQYTTTPGGPLPAGKTASPMSIFTPGSGVAGANGLNAFGLPEYTGITPGAALGKLGGIIGGGILSFFGLENSILSSSNPYNQAIQKGAVEGWRAWGPNTPATSTTGTGNVGTGDPSDPRTTALLNGTPAGTSGLATAGITTPSGSGSQVAPSANYSGGDAATHNAVYTAFVSAGYSPSEWNDLVTIINRESGWNPEARNPGSGAYGLAQFLGDSNVAKYLGGQNSGVPASTQAQGMMQYIKDRYGTPAKAKAFWDANGWYDNGGYLQPGTTLVHNETGKPEPVFTAPQWQTIQGAVDAAQNPPAPQAQQVQNTAQQLSPEIPGVIGQGKGSGANGSVTAAITGGLSSWAGGLLDQGAGSIGSIVSGIGGAAGGAAGGPLAGVAGGASFAAGGAKLGMDIASKAATKFVSSLGSGLGLGGSEVANLFQMTQIGKNTGIDGAPVQGGKTQPPTVNSGQQGGLKIDNLTVTSPDEFVDTVNRREQQQSQAALATAPR